MSGAWYSNGQTIDAIPIDDRSVQYGDGVFETIAIRNGQPRFLNLHIARLQVGCERLGLSCPDEDSIRTDLMAAIKQSDVAIQVAIAKIIVSAGAGPRGYQRLSTTSSEMRIGLFACKLIPASFYQDGIAVHLCNTRIACQPQLAGIKSLNRLEQVLGRSEWNDSGLFEGLMLDTDNRLICGTMSNVFISTQSSIITPALTRCGVSGIMRAHVISLLDANEIPYEVRDIGRDELFAADEVFLTNSQFGVLPVRNCMQQEWLVGEMCNRVQTLAATSGVPECAA